MDLKLLNWIKLRDNLIPLLPVNDPVLVSFSDHINDYHQLMPVLKKLTSPSVKVCTLYNCTCVCQLYAITF